MMNDPVCGMPVDPAKSPTDANIRATPIILPRPIASRNSMPSLTVIWRKRQGQSRRPVDVAPQQVMIPIAGMTCNHCAEQIEAALKAAPECCRCT